MSGLLGGAGGVPQWLRKVEVILAGGSTAFNLTEEFRITFNVVVTDTVTFNTVRIRIYNLSDNTVATILGAKGVEFTKVVLNAGYQPPGSFGGIFEGTITQFGHGRENNVSSYLDVFASDGDVLNYAVINQTLAGPTTQADQIGAIGKAVTPFGIVTGASELQQSGGVLPRGKVMFGQVTNVVRGFGKSRNSTWSVQNGTLKEIPLTGYLDGEIVIINSQTGLVGTPETTQQGITLTCLLNPKIFVGNRIQLNNREINQTIITNRVAAGPNGQAALGQFASESADGIYRVCANEFDGDTRGNPWYSHLTVIAVDPSAAPAASVSLYGGTGAAFPIAHGPT